MKIGKGLENPKCRILKPEHVVKAMEICQDISDYDPDSPSALQDMMDIMNAAESLMKKIEEEKEINLLSMRKRLLKLQEQEGELYFMIDRGQA